MLSSSPPPDAPAPLAGRVVVTTGAAARQQQGRRRDECGRSRSGSVDGHAGPGDRNHRGGTLRAMDLLLEMVRAVRGPAVPEGYGPPGAGDWSTGDGAGSSAGPDGRGVRVERDDCCPRGAGARSCRVYFSVVNSETRTRPSTPSPAASGVARPARHAGREMRTAHPSSHVRTVRSSRAGCDRAGRRRTGRRSDAGLGTAGGQAALRGAVEARTTRWAPVCTSRGGPS